MKVLGKIEETLRIIFRGVNRTVTVDPDVGSPAAGDVTLTVKGDAGAYSDEVTTNDADQTLTNKSLSDSTTQIVDEGDATKEIDFSVGGAATSTTTTIVAAQTVSRSLTLPDITDTVVTKTTTDVLENKTFGDPSDNTKALALDLDGAASGFTTTLDFNQQNDRTITFPDQTDQLVGRNTSDTLINKNINSDNNTITNIADADIKAAAAINATKIGSGDVTNTELDYIKDTTSVVLGKDQAGTLTNKDLVDASTNIVDDGDVTKKLAFEVSSITTGTTRTITVPDGDMIVGGDTNGTDILTKTGSQTAITNKMFSLPKLENTVGTGGDLVLASDDASMTADRTLTFDTTGSNRRIELSGDLTLSNDSITINSDDSLRLLTLFRNFKVDGNVNTEIDVTSPAEGDALLYDSATGKFENKPSGDVSFQIQSMQTDGSCLLKGGTILVDTGIEIVTYDGAGALSTDIEVDITIDLDTVGGFGDSDAPSGTAISYIYLDMDSLGVDLLITDNNRIVRTVTESNFVIKNDQPSAVDFNRFIPVGYAQYDTSQWATGLTDFGTTGRRRHDTTDAVTATSSYQATDTATNIDAAMPISHGIDGVPTNAILLVEDSGEWEIHDVGAYFNVTSTQVISTGTTLASIVGGATNCKIAFTNGGVAAGAQSWVTVEGATYPYTATVQEEVMVESGAAARTVTLPANPQVSQRVRVVDVGDNAATNNITVGRNGNPIEGVAADFIIDVSGVHTTFVYSDAVNGWEVLI